LIGVIENFAKNASSALIKQNKKDLVYIFLFLYVIEIK